MADYLFHYTCLKAAKSIVSSQIFWATNIATFDDKNELWGGLNPIDCYLEKIEETDGLNGFSTFIKKQISLYKQRLAMFNFYCISFCAEGDNSFMWSRYGKKNVVWFLIEQSFLKLSCDHPVGKSQWSLKILSHVNICHPRMFLHMSMPI